MEILVVIGGALLLTLIVILSVYDKEKYPEEK